MNKKLSEAMSKRYGFPEATQKDIESMAVESQTIESIKEMKQSGGWKIVSTKIKEELQKRILEKVKDDEVIKTLLDILTTTDVAQQEKVLEEAINQLIP